MSVSAFVAATYLLTPNPFLSFPQLEDFPREPPIVVDAATQCRPDTAYVTKAQIGYSDYEIVDPRCSALQRELVDAAYVGDLERVRQLIRSGANVNSPGWPTLGGNGMVPAWSRAIGTKRTDVLRLLLDNGADVNDSYSCCASHKSVLMHAIQARDIDSAKLLIARGADLSFVGQFGWSVIDFAEESENQEVRSLVLSACNSDLKCRAHARARRIGLAFGMSEDLRKL